MAFLLVGSCAAPAVSSILEGDRGVVQVGTESLDVVVADSPDERARGLMEVEDLGDVDGMLFVFERPSLVTFTMRNTVIPLDIWFIAVDGAIIGTAEMEPCNDDRCASYRSPGPVDRALETPLGEFEFEMGSVVSTVGSD